MYVALIATTVLLSGDSKSMNNCINKAKNMSKVDTKQEHNVNRPALTNTVMEGAEDLLHNTAFFNRF